MNCSRCNRELSKNQSYVHQGRVFCEDCLMDIGLSIKECDPWATFVDTSARRRHGERGAAFGCYGWSGESVKIIEDHLAQSKIPTVAEGVRAKWQPRAEELAKCRKLGSTVARAIKKQ